MPRVEPLGAAVIGVAGIGRTHLQAYRALSEASEPLCTLAAVCDVNASALEAARSEFGAAAAYADYRALLEWAAKDDPDAGNRETAATELRVLQTESDGK